MTASKTKLLSKARERFLIEGFYKISMDELSSDLKMSKKTIYSIFPSKNELVREIALNFMNSNFQMLEKIVSGKGNAIEKLTRIMSHFALISSQISTNFLKDLQTHMEEVWIEVESFRSVKLNDLMTKIILQGQKEKLFKLYPPELLILLFVRSISAMVTPATIIKFGYSLDKIVQLTVDVLLNGIATEKGAKVFNIHKESVKL